MLEKSNIHFILYNEERKELKSRLVEVDEPMQSFFRRLVLYYLYDEDFRWYVENYEGVAKVEFTCVEED